MNVKFQNRIIIRQAHNKKVTKRFHISEAATGGVLLKKVSLNISQNSQENTWVSFLIKFQVLDLQLLDLKVLDLRLWRSCFPVNFAKFLKTLFSQNTSGRLLLIFGLTELYTSLLTH